MHRELRVVLMKLISGQVFVSGHAPLSAVPGVIASCATPVMCKLSHLQHTQCNLGSSVCRNQQYLANYTSHTRLLGITGWCLMPLHHHNLHDTHAQTAAGCKYPKYPDISSGARVELSGFYCTVLAGLKRRG